MTYKTRMHSFAQSVYRHYNKKRRGSNHPKPLSSTSTGKGVGGFLFQRGNIGLSRLLFVLYKAGPEGITTNKLLKQLGSTNHAQAFIKRAEKEGLIKRIPEEPPAPDEFPPPRYKHRNRAW
jgi:hypothetical protein